MRAPDCCGAASAFSVCHRIMCWNAINGVQNRAFAGNVNWVGSIAQRDQDGGFLAVFTLACAQTDAGGDQWRIPVSFPENEIEQGEDCWDVPLLVLFSHEPG